MTCPRPSYYFNTLCLPLRSFYLSDFSRTHHLGPSRGQTPSTPRRELRGWEGFCLIYWKCLGAAGRGSRWDGRTCREEEGKWVGGSRGGQLVMNLTESCLCRRQKPGRPQNCSSEDSQVLSDELLQPSDGHRAQTAREGREGRRGRKKGPGSGE